LVEIHAVENEQGRRNAYCSKAWADRLENGRKRSSATQDKNLNISRMQRRRTPGFPCDPNNVVLLPVAILMVVMVMVMMMPTDVRVQQLIKSKLKILMTLVL
jgi:hypothetical protein